MEVDNNSLGKLEWAFMIIFVEWRMFDKSIYKIIIIVQRVKYWKFILPNFLWVKYKMNVIAKYKHSLTFKGSFTNRNI